MLKQDVLVAKKEKNMQEADEKTNDLTGLWSQLRRLARLHGEYLRLVMMEKMIVLFASLMLTFLLVGLGMMILFYAGGFSVQLLAKATGSLAVGHLIVAGAYLLLGGGIYLVRKRLIVRPLTKFISRLFFE